MAVTGLGQDGYVRIQKEVTYGTAVTNSMTLLPCLPGSTFETRDLNIDNMNVISSRLKQVPNIGRRTVSFSLQIDFPFTLIGTLYNLLLGTSANSGTNAYTHTWLCPRTGLSVGKSFTMQIAKGGDTAEQFVGCVFTSFKIASDSQGKIIVTMDGVGQTYTENVARISSFSYPAQIPANFSNIVLNLDPTDAAAFDQPCNSFELAIELGYDQENFKTGSRFINQPVFNSIPSCMLKANIDADRQFVVAAHSHTQYKGLITITSTEDAYTGTKFSSVFEVPAGKLNPETTIPFDNDRLTMDLDFDMGYGGTTTGSGAASVMFEVRNVDATATYA